MLHFSLASNSIKLTLGKFKKMYVCKVYSISDITYKIKIKHLICSIYTIKFTEKIEY